MPFITFDTLICQAKENSVLLMNLAKGVQDQRNKFVSHPVYSVGLRGLYLLRSLHSWGNSTEELKTHKQLKAVHSIITIFVKRFSVHQCERNGPIG
jgi:hypothetical protein